MTKRLIMLAAAFLLSLGGSVAVATPAQAAPQCPSGYLCLWTEFNFGGLRSQYNRAGVCIDVPPSTSSLYNNRPRSALLFAGPGCSVSQLLVGPGQWFDPMPAGWNDAVRSIRLN
ncbi:peptidase inhibitor family I36 protein [Allorhizocola rhizosphaerae]|uniref:peptidase inhibitor family I36 protein n=1 Tax=Allorhizocola rhizosphaerae TaxID=1872709 RepID=UPI000E3E2734|nr:peptidase inhibitor family I36 protein [Allorhizocola rhizosphaerae]